MNQGTKMETLKCPFLYGAEDPKLAKRAGCLLTAVAII